MICVSDVIKCIVNVILISIVQIAIDIINDVEIIYVCLIQIIKK